ncbi:hypothetical protein SPRG_04558 [Saprolegnia parasitica CBS 223.65]|uniref:Uncharacterized protein n=1 Tax=Saprolegnia parasitica (strain CBS 223.65) TaxID=695850 RepID=A0A067CV63_SAPPC|nr:hypothetical protein SPRG_04558 [Saprolegnia parasitica CBS 223.65]KDO30657.1 hypothetical protein SPRG_04558 [Saprolegnia parasitica CBS 223.65]|eukprot:XP_012198361.1 hypothetical protein SPRG_04558 [Saprolegnia parasitica CBS 223.65]
MPRAVDPLISACKDILKHHRVPSFYVCTGIQGMSLRPVVRVQGLRDLLALPLSPSQHQQLSARYGKARIVPASKVTIENQDAFVTALVDSVVGKIESVLGIQTTDVGAGCVNNAFGTLIVLLPSGHSGGVLTFQHKDRSMTLPHNVADVAKGFDGIFINTMMTSTPITSGRRLALVFHLTGVHKTPRGPSRLPLNATGYADEKGLDDYDFHKPYEQYSEEADEPLFPQLWPKHAHLADLLVATGCFDVALVRSTESDSDDNGVDTSVLTNQVKAFEFHPSCVVPKVVGERLYGISVHAFLGNYKPTEGGLWVDVPSQTALLFWPKRFRAGIVGMKTSLSLLRKAVRRGDPDCSKLGLSVNELALGIMVIFKSASFDYQDEERAGSARDGSTTLFGDLLRALNDVDLIEYFVAEAVSVSPTDGASRCPILLPDVASWVRACFKAYGWPRLSSVPALVSHLAGLPKEAPRRLEQPFFGAFLKASWYDVQSHSPFADGADAHCLLLDWHFETISPDLVHCDWLGDRLPLALVATIDAFLRPRRFGTCAGPCSRDVGLWRLDHVPTALMKAIESQPGVPTTPYTDAILHALDAIPVAQWPWRSVCEFTSAQGAALLSCMHLCNRVDPALLDVLVALCSENESKSNSSDHAVVKFFQAQPRVLVLDAAVTSHLVAFLLTNAAMLPELVKRSTRWWTLDAYAQLVADEILATPVGDCVLARVQAWVATLPSTRDANRHVVYVVIAKLCSEKSPARCRTLLGWLATTCRDAFVRSGTLEPVAGINDCVLDDICVNRRHCAECKALHRFFLDGTKVQRHMRRHVCPNVHATATAHHGWLRLEPVRIDGHWATLLRKVQQAGRMPIADAARANKYHASDTKCVEVLQAILAQLETTVA